MICQYEGKARLRHTDNAVHTVEWIVRTDDGEGARTLKKGKISYLILLLDDKTKYLFTRGRWEARPMLGRLREPVAHQMTKALIGMYNGKKVKGDEL